MAENSITIAESDLSTESKGLLRYSFNPSGNATVNRIKLLACALMTEYERIGDIQAKGYDDHGNDPLAPLPYEAQQAVTFLQTASMWGVLAATKGL